MPKEDIFWKKNQKILSSADRSGQKKYYNTVSTNGIAVLTDIIYLKIGITINKKIKIL